MKIAKMIRDVGKACSTSEHDVRVSKLCFDCVHNLLVQALRVEHAQTSIKLRKLLDAAEAEESKLAERFHTGDGSGAALTFATGKVEGFRQALAVISPKARQERATCAGCGRQKPARGKCICGETGNVAA